jgi:hypothetical protein
MLDMPGWDRFVHARPGRRFRDRYRRKRKVRGGTWKRVALVCTGIALALAGMFFMAVPGPGIPILAIGLALVAQESAAMARLLDRMEIRLRRLWKRFRKR